MSKFHIKILVLSAFIGISTDVKGASVGQQEEVDQNNRVTLQDLKEYVQPIIYQKFLRVPGDSLVALQAKTVVAQFLADSLVDSIKNPQPVEGQQEKAEPEQRPSLKQATNRPSIGSGISSLLPGGIRNLTRPRPSQAHVLGQVDSIIQNVNGANITGIVDQALLIRAPAPVRQLVNSILGLALCNPFNRLWNRCAGGGSIFGPGNTNTNTNTNTAPVPASG